MKHDDPSEAGRAKYQRMWDVTATVIKDWDPYRLLAGGAPTGEFDHEVALIVAQISRIHSAADAARAVSRVFASSFEADRFTVEMCSDVGKKLYASLSEQGFID